MLARVLAGVDAGEAERLLRGAVDAAAEAGDYRVASGYRRGAGEPAAGAGRLAEALAVAGEMAGYTRRAGLGPWTRLADQAGRLQVLGRMGEHGQVLAETEELRAAMAALPARRDASEAVNPWNVREVILDTGRSSALATGEWARCLELNAEIAASKRQRGAGVHEVTRTRFNDAGPLIRLGRLGEAGRLLAECQRVFEDHADTPDARHGPQHPRGPGGYARAPAGGGGPGADRAAAVLCPARAPGHRDRSSQPGELPRAAGGGPGGAGAHRLAAALIRQLVGMAHDARRHACVSWRRVARGRRCGHVVAVYGRAGRRGRRADQGVRLAALLTALQPDPSVVEAALAEILRAAAAPPAEDSGPDPASVVEQ